MQEAQLLSRPWHNLEQACERHSHIQAVKRYHQGAGAVEAGQRWWVTTALRPLC